MGKVLEALAFDGVGSRNRFVAAILAHALLRSTIDVAWSRLTSAVKNSDASGVSDIAVQNACVVPGVRFRRPSMTSASRLGERWPVRRTKARWLNRGFAAFFASYQSRRKRR